MASGAKLFIVDSRSVQQEKSEWPKAALTRYCNDRSSNEQVFA
jgi:hypothetical protein